MPTASTDNKEIAKYIAPILGINPSAKRFWDDNRENSLDIFSVDDPINSDTKFHGTIGVSDFPLYVNKELQPFRLELLIGGNKDLSEIPNILSTCGFYITKDSWECRPGNVFMRIVNMYYPNKTMSHIYFTTPFPWQEKLEPLQLENKKIVWLLAIPISDNELDFKNKNGDIALEKLLEKNEVDVFDLNRKSVI